MEYEDNKEKAVERWRRKAFEQERGYYLKANYGITLEEYNLRLKQQKNSCAICGNPDACNTRSKYNVFCVDHDHKTGQVRGLLCMPCNMIVVHSVEYYSHLLQRAKKYLKKSLTKHSSADNK